MIKISPIRWMISSFIRSCIKAFRNINFLMKQNAATIFMKCFRMPLEEGSVKRRNVEFLLLIKILPAFCFTFSLSFECCVKNAVFWGAPKTLTVFFKPLVSIYLDAASGNLSSLSMISLWWWLIPHLINVACYNSSNAKRWPSDEAAIIFFIPCADLNFVRL